MIFNDKLDEVLKILICTSGKNSLEITKFIKNLPKEFIDEIVISLNNLLLEDSKDLTYFKSDNWNYYCHIQKNKDEEKLYLGTYLKDDTNPIFYIELISNSLLDNIKNYSVIPIASSGFTTNGKKYSINYYLKKFPSEYLIISEAFKGRSTTSSKYHNYISLSDTNKELFHDNLDNIIQDKINIMKRKRNKN